MEDNMAPIEDENIIVDNTPSKISFHGDGSTYFGIVALNVVLTLVTLGLYYPWAKAAYRQYIWNETEFKGSRFVFNGTGREMFKGFIIAFGVLASIYIGASFGNPLVMLFIYPAILLIMPFAVYGAWRYRVTRTSWRGIFFAFDGKLGEFLKMYAVQILLTVVTLGIYSPWMKVNIQKYLFSHTRIGHLRLDFHGDGGDLFGINFLGYFLMYITLGLYIPIWIKKRFEFTVNNMTIQDEDKIRRFKTNLTNGEAWSVLMTNGLLLLVTLGLAYPWTFVRKTQMYFNSMEIPHEFDYDNLAQSDGDFRDATADEMVDIFDIGLDF